MYARNLESLCRLGDTSHYLGFVAGYSHAGGSESMSIGAVSSVMTRIPLCPTGIRVEAEHLQARLSLTAP